jgi:hypothetical protein
MAQSASKHTHKKKNFSKKELAKKLDKLAEKVSKRPIYVVTSTQDDFQIINYMDKSVLIPNIDTKVVADILCVRCNTRKITKARMDTIRNLLRDHSKLHHDCVYYTYTIQTTTDSDIRDIIQMRKDVTLDRIGYLIQKMKLV